MNATQTFRLAIIEQLIALVMLFALLPALLLLALFIQTNSDGPVIVSEELIAEGGRLARSYRFRTTGRGTAAFRAVGQFLRDYSIDDLPSLWSVACGGIRLGVVFGWR